jgi:hypothetical protein
MRQNLLRLTKFNMMKKAFLKFRDNCKTLKTLIKMNKINFKVAKKRATGWGSAPDPARELTALP